MMFLMPKSTSPNSKIHMKWKHPVNYTYLMTYPLSIMTFKGHEKIIIYH